jgi:hypothetical protein
MCVIWEVISKKKNQNEKTTLKFIVHVANLLRIFLYSGARSTKVFAWTEENFQRTYCAVFANEIGDN